MIFILPPPLYDFVNLIFIFRNKQFEGSFQTSIAR